MAMALLRDFLAKQGIQVALLDLCNNGQSYCLNNPIADDPAAAQVKLIIDAARAEGAQRVVLVGASLDGSVAVTAASQAGQTGCDRHFVQLR
jgi:pimeloyl-ACP methyl ester carboxylesterase